MHVSIICLTLIIHLSVSNAQVEFKIGGLIHGIKSQAYLNRNHDSDDDRMLSHTEYEEELSSGIIPTIRYASRQIGYYFQKHYNCNIKLELKDTQVIHILINFSSRTRNCTDAVLNSAMLPILQMHFSISQMMTKTHYYCLVVDLVRVRYIH